MTIALFVGQRPRDGRGAKLLHCYFVALGMKGFDPVRLDVIGGGNRIRTGE
jgi:hypothetical protein